MPDTDEWTAPQLDQRMAAAKSVTKIANPDITFLSNSPRDPLGPANGQSDARATHVTLLLNLYPRTEKACILWSEPYVTVAIAVTAAPAA